MIRVAIVAHHPITRQGIVGILPHARFEVVSMHETLDEIGFDDTEIVVLDEETTGRSPGLGEVASTMPIVLVTDSDHAMALRLGVRAVVPRNVNPAQIAAAIEAAASGLTAITPRLARDLANRSGTSEAGEGPLTGREQSVLNLMADGLSNKIIAHKLSLSEHTVKFHVNSILTKLGAGTRTEAVTRALRRGLLYL